MTSASVDKSRQRLRIGGAPVDSLSFVDLLRELDRLVDAPGSRYVCFCEAHLCVRATLDLEIRRILEGASLVLPDGVSMTLGARLLRHKLATRLPGPVVMLEYLRHGVQYGRRHFFYGGQAA